MNIIYSHRLRANTRVILSAFLAVVMLVALFASATRGRAAQIVQNAQFDAGTTSWAIDNNGGGASTFTVDATSQLSGVNSAKVVISNGSTNLYNVQLKQLLPVTAGKSYQITFMARSSVNRTIQLVVQKSVTPWTNYYTQNVNITTGSATYGPYTFNATVTDAAAGIYFNIGGSANTVYIDNVAMNDGTVAATSTSTATRTVTPVPPTATATRTNTPVPSSTVRIEAGGAANYTDASGNLWLADTGFTAGAGGVADRGVGLAIANTTNDRIYQTERWGMTAFAYAVPNGTYTVNLHLAETYWTAAGQRVFSANVEGTAINNIDVFAQAGGMNTALVKSVCVNVADGQLSVAFTASVDNAEINGIEIIPAANCPAATATPTATRTPTPGAVSGVAISQNLVGANYWWYEPSTTVWTLTGQIGLKTVRIGGIQFDDNPMPNATIAGWVTKIKAIGAAPMVQVSRFSSAANAAAIVSYFNGTNGNNGVNRVQFWNIGNEPHCNSGFNNDPVAAAADMASYTKSLSAAMKAIDPTIIIYAADSCKYDAPVFNLLFKGDNSSSDITGKVPGKTYYYVDGLSWHTYTGFEYPTAITVGQLTTVGASEFESNAYNTSLLLNAANAAQNRTGANALKWGVGEFNDDRGEMTCSFEDGQMFGQAYGSFMKYGATYATAWSLAEGGSDCAASTTDRGIIDEDTGKPRSSYYHMQMVAQNFSGTYLNGTSNLTSMRTYGGYDAGVNRIAVMLMNIDTTTSRTCTVRLNTDAVAGTCQVNIPAGVAVSYNKTIGPQTTVVLIFNLQGQLTKTITYSKSGNWTQDVAPSVTIP